MSYPKAPDKKIQKLTNLLIRSAERQGLEFSFSEEDIYAVEAFSHFGGLSLFLLEAKEIYEKLYNKIYSIEELLTVYDKPLAKNSKNKKQHVLTEEQKNKEREYLLNLPKKYIFPMELVEQEEGTYFGFIPRVSPEIEPDFVTFAHFTHYALEEYVKNYKLKLSNDKKNTNDGVNSKIVIPLDPLYDKMVQKINNKEVLILNATTARDLYLHIDNKSSVKMSENI